MDLTKTIRDVPDFPKKGILFKDITTLLKEPAAFKETLSQMKAYCKNRPIQKVCGVESRGFIFGAPLALELGVGFIPIRKAGKLPAQTMSQEYALEYGTDKIEIHTDAIQKNDQVLIVDDLLATGGTVAACTTLVKKMGAEVCGILFLIELGFLNGRDKLKGYDVHSLIQY